MQIKRVTPSGYVWDKRIFWGAILIMLSILGYIFYINDFYFGPHFYFVCDKPLGCENPVYNGQYSMYFMDKSHPSRYACEWCSQPFLPYGEYGTPQPNYINGFTILAVSLVILSICINHFVHNSGKKVDISFKEKPAILKLLSEENDEEDKRNQP